MKVLMSAASKHEATAEIAEEVGNLSCPLQTLNRKSQRKQTIFDSKPLGVTAWIFLENMQLNSPKIVSMYWRMGFAKNSVHAECGRLEFFFLWQMIFTSISSSKSS